VSKSLPVLTGLEAKVFEAALHRVDTLQNELERLGNEYSDREDLPGNRIVLRALGLIVGESRREIVREGRRLAERDRTESVDNGFLRSIGSRTQTLDSLVHDYMPRATRTPGREVETLVRPLTRLVNTIFTDRELIFDPADGYEIILSSVQEPLTVYARYFSHNVWEAIKALPHVTVISYPALSQDDALQHLLLGHEIGHLVLSKEVSLDGGNADKVKLETLVFNLAFSEGIARLQQESPVKLSSADRRELHFRLQSIFRELASDILGVRLMGPAYAIALADYEAVRNRWAHGGVSQTHPGLAWRLRTVISEARRFLDVDRETAPWVSARAALTELEQMIPEDLETMSDAERAIIDRSLALLDERLDQEIGDAQLLVGELERLFDPVWDKLMHSIPPAEEIFRRSRPDVPQPPFPASVGNRARDILRTGLRGGRRPVADDIEPPNPWSQPIDWRVVLNAAAFCWAANALPYEGTNTEHLPIDPRRSAQRRELNELVRGTIELAETHLRLQEVKDELDDMNFVR